MTWRYVISVSAEVVPKREISKNVRVARLDRLVAWGKHRLLGILGLEKSRRPDPKHVTAAPWPRILRLTHALATCIV